MKKTLLTFGTVLGVSTGAFAQGSIVLETAATTPGVAFGQWNPAVTSDWYTGSLTLQVYYAPGSDSSAASEIAAINSYETVSGGWPDIAALAADTDFTLEPIAHASSGTLGNGNTSVTIACSGGVIDTTVDLPNVPSESNAYWIIEGYETVYVGLVGLDNMSTGAPGAPEDDAVAWNAAGINMLFGVPEPTTLALAGLGGFSTLVLRRRKA